MSRSSRPEATAWKLSAQRRLGNRQPESWDWKAESQAQKQPVQQQQNGAVACKEDAWNSRTCGGHDSAERLQEDHGQRTEHCLGESAGQGFIACVGRAGKRYSRH